MKITRVALILIAAVIGLSGCVDVLQYLSGDGSTIDVYLRLTLQKGAFELANSFEDEPQDLEELYQDELGVSEQEVLEEFPLSVTPDFTIVDTPHEYGFELKYSASRNELDRERSTDDAFVPVVRRDGLSIPISGDDSGQAEMGGGEGDEFANAFLGGSKYRLMISKRLVSRVSQARLVTPEDSTPVAITELPDVWMVEFPSSLWLSAPRGSSLEVVF